MKYKTTSDYTVGHQFQITTRGLPSFVFVLQANLPSRSLLYSTCYSYLPVRITHDTE
jgi:hypothetical protein